MSAGSDLTGSSKENIYEELSCLLDACDNWLKSASDAGMLNHCLGVKICVMVMYSEFY